MAETPPDMPVRRTGFARWGMPTLVGAMLGLLIGGVVGGVMGYEDVQTAWAQAGSSGEGAAGAIIYTPFAMVFEIGRGALLGLGGGLVAGLLFGVVRSAGEKPVYAMDSKASAAPPPPPPEPPA